jgi:hypothetical protein
MQKIAQYKLEAGPSFTRTNGENSLFSKPIETNLGGASELRDHEGKFANWELEFSKFVHMYKATITSSEIQNFLERKRFQLPVPETGIFDEVKAIANFIYRHFQLVPSFREPKK